MRSPTNHHELQLTYLLLTGRGRRQLGVKGAHSRAARNSALLNGGSEPENGCCKT